MTLPSLPELGWYALALGWHLLLATCAVQEWKTGRIVLYLPGSTLLLALLLALAGVAPGAPPDGSWWPPVLTGVLAAAVMAASAGIQTRWGRDPALRTGWADALLLAAAGVWLGWRALPAALLLACILGGLQVVLARRRKQRTRAVKFAPLLALSVIACEVLHYVS